MSKCFVHGKPKGKARPRFVHGHTYTPRETVNYERDIATSYIEHGGELHEGACALRVVAYFTIPKSWPKYKKTQQKGLPHTQKPDIDNLIKAILDGLNGVAWKDDAQVCKVTASKRWYDGKPMAIVIVEED